jgi:hypothetical protein
VARSTDWIDAEFEATKAGSTFATFGAVETAPATGGVLTNDTDSDGVLMDATLVMGPSNASAFTFNADGTFSYTPSAGFTGTDSFIYQLNDDFAFGSDTALVTFTVSGAPVANDDPSVYNATVTDLNPISYWRLGESAGPTATDSGSAGADGTYVGGTTLSQPGAITGDADTAVYFDGKPT